MDPYASTGGRTRVDALFGPRGRPHFLSHHWSRCPLRVVGPPDGWDDVYDLNGWYMGSGLSDAVTPPAGGRPRVELDLPAMYEAYAAGGTICAAICDKNLKRFMAHLAASLSCTATASFAKLYASGSTGSGFPWHWDAHHVFVLQLAGRKDWLFGRQVGVVNPRTSGGLDSMGVAVYSPAVRQNAAEATTPVDPVAASVRQPVATECDKVTLAPGDSLYLPPGIWHRGQAVGHSIALSLSPVAG